MRYDRIIKSTPRVPLHQRIGGLSIGLAWWFASPAAGQVIYFNSPTENAADETVRQTGEMVRLDAASRATTVVQTGLHYPSGVAFDQAGDLYFGDTTFNPLAVHLMEQPPGGAVRNLGTVFSTNATEYASIGGWGFDLVEHDDALYFNSPQLTTMGGSLVRSGSIQRFDPATGAQSTVLAGLHNPGGIAFDSRGNLYVGDITSNPFKAQILRLAHDGTLSTLASAFETTSNSAVAIGGWGLSLAVYDNALYFNRPTIRLVAGPILQAGSIERIDLTTGAENTIVPNLSFPSGLSFDSNGDLFFGNVSFGPFNSELMERPAAGGLVDLGAVPGWSSSYVTIGGWALDTASQVPEPDALAAALLPIALVLTRSSAHRRLMLRLGFD